ncbi:hypothetical protein AB0L14_01525 [Streptomyces sp. NPDC052727]|uniref:hypothetical protein n=1 Tax=Streptomyces sp. NPDC052727 TaxID=3154854 RepID=UPI003441CE83
MHRPTGPEATSVAGQVAAIGEAHGGKLTFVETDPAEAGPQLYPHVPPQMLERPLRTFTATVGVPRRSPAPWRLTGTPARTFAQWARDHTDDVRAYPRTGPNASWPYGSTHFRVPFARLSGHRAPFRYKLELHPKPEAPDPRRGARAEEGS